MTRLVLYFRCVFCKHVFKVEEATKQYWRYMGGEKHIYNEEVFVYQRCDICGYHETFKKFP